MCPLKPSRHGWGGIRACARQALASILRADLVRFLGCPTASREACDPRRWLISRDRPRAPPPPPSPVQPRNWLQQVSQAGPKTPNKRPGAPTCSTELSDGCTGREGTRSCVEDGEQSCAEHLARYTREARIVAVRLTLCCLWRCEVEGGSRPFARCALFLQQHLVPLQCLMPSDSQEPLASALPGSWPIAYPLGAPLESIQPSPLASMDALQAARVSARA